VDQSHSIGSRCGSDRTCHAHWSLQPTGKLLFFVHGFGGGAATAAWRNFPKLLLQDNRWAGWDLFFYGYDSRNVRAGTSAQVLNGQLRNVIENPAYADAWLLQPRSQNFRYDEIWLVAHSLGAPVARQSLLQAARDGRGWLGLTRLVCFAPASTGARIEYLLRESGLFSGLTILRILNAFFRYRWSALDDLRVGSNFLANLLAETTQATASNPGDPFFSRLTLFGTHERVIDYPPPFPFDKNVELIHGADHFSVCKPRHIGDEPYLKLVHELRP
jgi:pimeloyl-ACP methyl ester carboxylesterase